MTDDIATIREALDKPWCPNLGNTSPEMHSGCSYCADHQDAVAALDRVAARLALVEAARVAAEDDVRRQDERAEQAELLLKGARRERDIQANAWKAQLEQAERDRDNLAFYEFIPCHDWRAISLRAESAEARARELTDALVAIMGVIDRVWQSDTRAALAAHTKEPA